MSATPPAASALIADITTVADRARGMSAIGAAQNVGAVAGPALGGLLAVIPLLTPIWVAAAGTLVALSIIVVATDEAVLFGAMTLLGLGMGLASPAFTAGASLAVGAEEQGALAGVTSSCPPLGFTIGPLLGTALYQMDGRLPYVAWWRSRCS